MASQMVQSSFEVLKDVQGLENENVEFNSAKIKGDEYEFGSYKKKVEELEPGATQLGGEVMEVLDEEKNRRFHLPTELISEILSRLPVKSLIQFTIVCIAWKSLIESPEFISLHIKRYPLNPNLAYSSLVVGFDFMDLRETCFHVENPLYKSVDIDFSFLGDMDTLMVVGVWNGLICVCLSYDESDFAICNVATRRFNRLPPLKPCLDLDNRVGVCGFDRSIFGFGLHPSVDDYKLVRLARTYATGDIHHAEIYSLNSDAWKVVELNMPSKTLFSITEPGCCIEAPVLINGIFYWGAIKESSSEGVIVSFDMNDEVLRLIDLPQCYHGKSIAFQMIQLKEEVAILVQGGVSSLWLLNVDTRIWSLKFQIPIFATCTLGIIYLTRNPRNGDSVEEQIADQKLSLNDLGEKVKEEQYTCLNDFQYRCYFYYESLLPVKKHD